MYAEFSYDIAAGAQQNVSVLSEILKKFEVKPNGQARQRCDLLSDTFISEVENTADYLAVVRKLRKVGNDVDGQFQFVITLHAAGAALRSNATFPKAKANDIIDPEEE